MHLHRAAIAALLLSGCGGSDGTPPTIEAPEPPPPVIEEPEPPLVPTTPPSDPEPPVEPDTEPVPPLVPTSQSVGPCDPVHAEIAQRVADVMGVDSVGQSWAYCDHYTPGYRDRSWPAWGWLYLDCRPEHWFYLLGCSQGWSFDGIGRVGGNIGGLLVSPAQMDALIAEAQSMRLSPGSQTWAEIRCTWTPERYAAVLVHEINHSWHGMTHGAAMAQADTEARTRLMAEHGEWLRAIPMPGCPSPRRMLAPDEPITERIEP